LENESLDAKTELREGAKRLFRLFSTQTKGDLLILFHLNPGLIDTIDAVARRIGRTAKEIDEDVRDLVTIGILRTRKIGSYEVITFNKSKDDEAQESIVSHLKSIKTGRAG
jgi:predicted transcriptional regulator